MDGKTLSSFKLFSKNIYLFKWYKRKDSIKEIPRKIYVIQISTLQMKMDIKKCCKVFVVHVVNNEQSHKEGKLQFEDIPILQDFSDVSVEEILGLPSKRDLDFMIELVPWAVPNSKDPYRMNILELNVLKLQLQELPSIKQNDN